jgi:integrase/recombinase XerD
MKLTEVIAQYGALRKAMGEHFDSAASVLQTFCRQMAPDSDIEDIHADRVAAFLAGTGPVTRYWHRKHGVLRGLYTYAISRGIVAASPLPPMVPKLPPRFVPHIYTHEELRRLVRATPSYRQHSRKLEPHTLRTMILLLYGAGLRVSEAVALSLGDVDFPNALLTVRNTKFYKTRLVPLGTDLQQVMTQYLTQRQEAGHSQRQEAGHSQRPGTPFFVLRRGTPVSVQIVQQNFRRLCEYVGVRRSDGARYQPRLHDLRHSFAVHRLTSWYRQGADVQTLLPYLSTYLGHVNLAATQVYLTMTPELLQEASRRFQQYACEERYHD